MTILSQHSQETQAPVPVKCYAIQEEGANFSSWDTELPPIGPEEVDIAVMTVGFGRADLEAIENASGMTQYPFVPGAELIGVIRQMGHEVKSKMEQKSQTTSSVHFATPKKGYPEQAGSQPSSSQPTSGAGQHEPSSDEPQHLAAPFLKEGMRVGVGQTSYSCNSKDCPQCSFPNCEQSCPMGIHTIFGNMPVMRHVHDPSISRASKVNISGESQEAHRNMDKCSGLLRNNNCHDGGFANIVRVHYKWVFPIPEGVSTEIASLMMFSGASIYSALRLYTTYTGHGKHLASKPDYKPHVAIIGCGVLAKLGVALGKLLNNHVSVIVPHQTDQTTLNIMKEFGADEFIHENEMQRHMQSMDLVLVTSVQPQTSLDAWLTLCKRNSSLVLLGLTEGHTTYIVKEMEGGSKVPGENVTPYSPNKSGGGKSAESSNIQMRKFETLGTSDYLKFHSNPIIFHNLSIVGSYGASRNHIFDLLALLKAHPEIQELIRRHIVVTVPFEQAMQQNSGCDLIHAIKEGEWIGKGVVLVRQNLP